MAVCLVTVVGALAVPTYLAARAAVTSPAGATAGLHLPPEGPNLVGLLPFSGPTTADEIVQACLPDRSAAAEDCYSQKLNDLLLAQGAEKAFRELDNLTKLDQVIANDGHPMAHTLGRATLDAYGGVTTALRNCPYYLSSGCFHGVMQSFFDTQANFDMRLLPLICPTEDSFRLFQCQHGLGHGLEIYTNYDLNRSLSLCDTLPGAYQQASCETGAIMENLMGYLESIHPSGAGGHNHNHATGGPPPVYMLKADDPQYPCDVIGAQYGHTCYIFQTSVYLQLHNWDIGGAARMCDAAPAEFLSDCYNSLGRDVSAAAQRDAPTAYSLCTKSSEAGLPDCIKGFVEEMVNNAANPKAGFAVCAVLPANAQQPCFQAIGFMAASMALDAAKRTAICHDAGEFETACRKEAQL
jgi:hypothetical protein